MSDSIIKLHDAIENKPPVGQEHYGIRIKRLIGGLKEELERLRTENEALMQQAQIWKQEARTMQNIVAECYQAVTGSAGEPGDWNGANPVRELVQERDKMESALKKMISIYIIDDYIYGEDRINEINKRFDRMMREA